MLLSISLREIVRESGLQSLIFTLPRCLTLTYCIDLFPTMFTWVFNSHCGGLDCRESEELKVEVELLGDLVYIVPGGLIADEFKGDG